MYLSISFYGHNSKCGISRYAGLLMRAAGRYCNTIAIYSIDGSAAYDKGRPQQYFGKSSHITLNGWSFLSIYRAARSINAPQAIAHFHFPPAHKSFPYFCAPLIFRLLGFNVVQTWHEELSRAGWLRALLLRTASNKIFVVKKDFVQRSSVLSRWVLKLFNIQCVCSLPLQQIVPKKTKEIDRFFEAHSLNRKKRLFVVIGFLFPKRNIELLLTCLNPSTDNLLIIGDHTINPKYYKKLKKIIKCQNLETSVKFLGFVDDNLLSGIYYYANAVIFTNKGGVFDWNTSFLMSCYSGRPVVYLYDHRKGKPIIDGFTGSTRDFGLPEIEVDALKEQMCLASAIQCHEEKQEDILELWQRLFKSHKFFVGLKDG